VIVLYRHAHAGSRERWEGDDRQRPLSDKGRRQADLMARSLARLPIQRILSSPYVRCVQTVEPLARRLAMAVEEIPELAEGTPPREVTRLLRRVLNEDVVLCSHGDVVLTVLDELEAEGATFEGGDPGRAEKGAAWVLELPRGRPAQARYMAPPQL
jgi:8-oxo-dGTP diphosphatase